jgi:lipid-A-disaccharide synthase
MTPTPILLSAGEASGDMYAARLATALKSRANVDLFGMGGPRMREAGVDTIVDYSEVSVVGITEVVKHLPQLRAAMSKLVIAAQKRNAPYAILTDFPGFHLRLARKLLPLATRNIYYICPQFWAWRPWRANLVRRRFVKALCIFPFEEKFYRDAGVNVEFIGHPLVGNVRATQTRAEFCATHSLDPLAPIVTILPGSRRGEIAYHIPILAAALTQIRTAIPNLQTVIAIAPHVDHSMIEQSFATSAAAASQKNARTLFVESSTYNAIHAADLALISSGTATVETALLQKPMIVFYKLSPLTATLAKPLVRTKFFSMVNLIVGRAVVPELIQDDFTPERLAAEAVPLLSASNESKEKLAKMRENLAEVTQLLGPPGAVDRAADAIVAQLRLTQSNAK